MEKHADKGTIRARMNPVSIVLEFSDLKIVHSIKNISVNNDSQIEILKNDYSE